ncbi:MAG: hypothetical protein OXF05_06190 [Hyphomicrobiales bacterium]|nr:hypothetical protein [Hyphomicrobiales bacterium]MCY4038168.1 hypothetical protein [Hyphomicrobiales bacterium]
MKSLSKHAEGEDKPERNMYNTFTSKKLSSTMPFGARTLVLSLLLTRP